MAHEHIIKEYDQELLELQLILTKMGNDSLAMLKDGCQAFITNDRPLALTTIAADKNVNSANYQITLNAQNLIALRSPMANDLRLILTSLQVATNLERVGDLSKNIAKIIRDNDLFVETALLDDFQRLADLVIKNVSDVMIGFSELDQNAVRLAYDTDRRIDGEYKALFAHVLERANSHDPNINSLLHFLFAIRHLERVSDHAKNIAEQTHYAATGQLDHLDLLDDSQKKT